MKWIIRHAPHGLLALGLIALLMGAMGVQADAQTQTLNPSTTSHGIVLTGSHGQSVELSSAADALANYPFVNGETVTVTFDPSIGSVVLYTYMDSQGVKQKLHSGFQNFTFTWGDEVCQLDGLIAGASAPDEITFGDLTDVLHIIATFNGYAAAGIVGCDWPAIPTTTTTTPIPTTTAPPSTVPTPTTTTALPTTTTAPPTTSPAPTTSTTFPTNVTVKAGEHLVQQPSAPASPATPFAMLGATCVSLAAVWALVQRRNNAVAAGQNRAV